MQRDERGSIELPLFSSVNNAQIKKYNRSSYRSILNPRVASVVYTSIQDQLPPGPLRRDKGSGTNDCMALTTSIVA